MVMPQTFVVSINVMFFNNVNVNQTFSFKIKHDVIWGLIMTESLLYSRRNKTLKAFWQTDNAIIKDLLTLLVANSFICRGKAFNKYLINDLTTL
jgi:hypothetical protein